MKRQRAKTPTKILEMRGSWRAKTRTNEPQAPPLKPKAPVWLDAEGKRLWRIWWKRLDACGILTTVDEIAFARYCQILARWIKMERFMQEHGEVYPIRDSSGKVTSMAIFPQVGLYLRLSDQLIRMEQAFGLTPASRASVQKRDVPPHGNSSEAKDKRRFFAS
jgi:P27 family predicted phage terminase small subunit